MAKTDYQATYKKSRSSTQLMSDGACILPLLIDALNDRKNRLLLTAQVGLPDNQFEAYRKILLDELGRNGFERDLEEILKQQTEENGMGRQIQAGKEVPK